MFGAMNLLRRTLTIAALPCLALFCPAPAAPEAWEKEISQLTALDATQPPPRHGVVFVGSSSIRLWSSLAAVFPGVPVINRGFGGSELADSVHFLDRLVLPYAPRLVVLYAGDNDLWAGKSPETVAADFRAFRTRLHAALPETKLIFLAVKLSPSRARVRAQVLAANALVAADCATDARCRFVDVASPLLGPDGAPRPEFFREDRLHLRPEGYAVWTRVLAPYLRP